jgi:TetR/AcrR family transcriptional regulator, regulator of cefoperazone and chloramphenicol sensitivity
MTESLPDDTRQRLISAAGEVFAEHGFHAATVRDICGKAQANVAAVNYYFGDKMGLYIETVQAAHCGGPEIIKPQWPEGISPQDKLRFFIRRWLEHFLDEHRPSWHTRLMLNEMAEPTEACAKLVEAYIRPMADTLHDIVRELVPSDVSLEQRWLIGFSIVGQCLFYKVHRPVAELLMGPANYRKLDLDLLADHIGRFSLAALGHGEPVDRDNELIARDRTS